MAILQSGVFSTQARDLRELATIGRGTEWLKVSFERSVTNVRRAVQQMKIEYPGS